MKIVTLSTYPVSTPFHGGQRRVDAISRELRRAGHSVTSVPVFFEGNYPAHDAEDAQTALPSTALGDLIARGMREDLHMHTLLTPGTAELDALRTRLLALAPDILQFEHPWLLPLLDLILETLPGPDCPRVVYSAHNIEAELAPARFKPEVTALERAAAARADLIIAVSQNDADTLSDWAATGRGAPVIVAPNGCWPPMPDMNKPRPIPQDYLLVVGSSHSPNAEGYWEVIGKIPGCIPPDGQLVVAGGVGDLLRADPRHRHFQLLNKHLVHLTGTIDEDHLQTLLTHALGIALPIKSGGGTNLKTAEALLTLKPIVAMEPAMRGYDDARRLPGVHVAETEGNFRDLVRQLFAGTLTGQRRPDDVTHYTWDATLAGLAPAYNSLTCAV